MRANEFITEASLPRLIKQGASDNFESIKEELVNYNHLKHAWQVRNDDNYSIRHEKDNVILRNPEPYIDDDAYIDGKRIYAYMKGAEVKQEPDLSGYKQHPIKFVPDDRDYPFVHMETGEPIENAEYAVFKKHNAYLYTKSDDDQITEAWSEKYKRSINCSNPKGFSQRAHCQGKKKTNEEQLDEKCWDSYKQVGMKNKSGKMVPNCVPKESIDETSEEQLEEDLRKWFKEKWVRFGPDGKIRGACARGSEGEGKPKCLPQNKAHALGKKGRASAASRKRRQDPNPERQGKAKNVPTKSTRDKK